MLERLPLLDHDSLACSHENTLFEESASQFVETKEDEWGEFQYAVASENTKKEGTILLILVLIPSSPI